MKKNIGFISTRFSGTDGVTLEASKWAAVFEQSGFNCFWFAGELDRENKICSLVPEAHFQHSLNRSINEQIFGRRGRSPATTRMIHGARRQLKPRIHEFINRFQIDIIIAENSTIPTVNWLFPMKPETRGMIMRNGSRSMPVSTMWTCALSGPGLTIRFIIKPAPRRDTPCGIFIPMRIS